LDEVPDNVAEAMLTEASRNQTARRAATLLAARDARFRVPTAAQKRLLLVEFARRNMVVYGKAFDIVKLLAEVDLNNATEVAANLDSIILCEIKSTNRKLPTDFKGYFFALTAAEMLVAQSLKQQFQFVFYNTTSGDYIELALNAVFAKARGIYPTWSVCF
jgi:hypothetical protein